MNVLRTALISFVLATPLAALAQSTPKFDQRQANQEQRIEQGVQSGTLTQVEATRLSQGQDRLQAKEDRAKADGVVTKRERVALQRAEDKQSARIYSQKRDRQHDLNHNGKVDRLRNVRK